MQNVMMMINVLFVCQLSEIEINENLANMTYSN